MDFVKLASICNLKQWSTIAKTDLSDSGYPVWGANGIIGYSNKYNHTERTIMICCRGATCGSINISDGKCYINGNAMCLDNLSKEFNLDFIAYYLKNYDFKKTITGVAQPQITKVSLDIVEVPKLPIERQQEIAQNLKKLELCLTKTRIKLKKYDDLVKSQFIEMFGDPLSNNLFELYELNTVCDVRDGTHDSPKYHDIGYPLITSKNIIDGGISFEDVNLISKEDYDKINQRSFVDNGDILMPMIGTIGNPVIVDKIRDFAIKNVALIKFYKDSKIDNHFLYYLMKSDSFNHYLKDKNKGGTQKFVSLGIIRKIKIITPPIELQNQFADFVKHIDKLKFTIKQSIEKLELCYESLMKQYFD